MCLPVFSSKRFCRRLPQLFFAFVSQSSLVMWNAPLTLLCICLSVFSPKKVLWKGPPNFSRHVSPNLFFEKVLWRAPLTFLYIYVFQPSLRKRLCGRLSQQFSLHLSPSLLFTKGAVQGSFSLHLAHSRFFDPGSVEGSGPYLKHGLGRP